MISEFALEIISRLTRPVSWIHFPVPKDRIDEAYLMPMKETLLPRLDPHTELYAGLIHPHDLVGTERRLTVARKVLRDDIGVATECGLGRKDQEWLDSELDIATKL